MIYDVIDEWAIWEADWFEDASDFEYFYLVCADEILYRLSKAAGVPGGRSLPEVY